MINIENIDIFTQTIANFGFPIAVTVFLLLKLERKLEKLASSINELNTTITLMLKGSNK